MTTLVSDPYLIGGALLVITAVLMVLIGLLDHLRGGR